MPYWKRPGISDEPESQTCYYMDKKIIVAPDSA